MFFNLSNHPSNKWTAEQHEAALALGKCESVIDVTFPSVDPDATTEQVESQAKALWESIRKQIDDAVNAVIMVQGEMTFVYSFVNLVHEEYADRRISVVAATTKRVAVDNADGSKTSVFKFNSFRRYY